jgi:hypothetical protein
MRDKLEHLWTYASFQTHLHAPPPKKDKTYSKPWMMSHNAGQNSQGPKFMYWNMKPTNDELGECNELRSKTSISHSKLRV